MSRRRRRPGLVLVGAVLTTLLPTVALAQDDFPDFTAPVVDQARVVPDDVEQRVGAGLQDYQRRSGNQVAVAVVRTTGRRSLEDYSIDLAREWGVGTKDKDNGVLLLIAYDDRKLRIEVGRGLEGTLTDLESGRIIRERLVPLLRRGDVGGAVTRGSDAIRQELGDTQVGRLPPVPAGEEAPDEGGGGFPWLFLLAVPVLGLAFLGRGRRRGWGGPVFYGGGWGGYSGGGGGFSSGGGGFGGGGGGGFGGGGASGGW